MSPEASKAHRWTKSLLFEPEKRLLMWMCSKMPSWVMPDHLTLLAVFSSIWIGAAYALSHYGAGWLWLASLGLVVHWYGDSMDGSLARFRRISRPKYGFYVDHLADAFATVFIGIGLGLSPYMLLAVGLAIVVMYLVLSLNVYLETITRQQFRLGYGIIGPTEGRIFLILLNTMAIILGPIPFTILSINATIFDVIGMGAVIGMVGMLIRRIRRNLGILGELEPPNVVKDE
jgi:phosphatidylglycerophosphate synthase